MTTVAAIQSLYDENRFLEAYRQSSGYWNACQSIDGLSTSVLILGGRLAMRLGGFRLSRRLFLAAWKRDPIDPQVRYFTLGVRHPRGILEQLQEWEANPELPGADAVTQSSWLASQAVAWASLRDFSRAYSCIARARSFQERDGWIFCCESNVFGMEDRPEEALKAAETAWELSFGAPYCAQSLGNALLNAHRIREASERLSAASETGESFEVAQLACWYLCAFSETVDGEERTRALDRAHQCADRLGTLAPLADRETRTSIARTMLDIAGLEDDHAAMERWAKEARSPFHRKVLENLRANPTGRRVRMPFRHAIQKHEACLPTSVSSALEGMGISLDADAMTSQITFGGTPEWAAAEWLEARGFGVRFFIVTPEIAERLVANGIPFVMTLEADANAHAVAVMGVDEAQGTLILHDPQSLRASEYLLAAIGKNETPLGPKGMAVVPKEKLALLDGLLPAADVAAASATEAYHQAVELRGAAAGREVVDTLARQCPSHPITRFLQGVQNVQGGRVGLALREFQDLVKSHPGSARARAMLLSCSRSLGDTALMRKTIASVVEQGLLPGIQSQQTWRRPPSAYVCEYADLLRLSADTRGQALSLLHGVIEREGGCAQAWHNLGDLYFDERNFQAALPVYRIAACLAESNEHFARAYCDALGRAGRLEEGLQWLEGRVRKFGSQSRAVATWITWTDALEDWGQPERAIAASREACMVHSASAELLAFVVPFFARMGLWEESEALLSRLQNAGNPNLFHEAAVDFYRRRGQLNSAFEHAELWVKESPLSMQARKGLLQVIAKRDGAAAALNRAIEWVKENPGHDEIEQGCCYYLDRSLSPRRKKYMLLRRRLRRNPEDGWAWRELAFAAISDYEMRADRVRERLARRIAGFLSQCERVAPQEAATLRASAQWAEARGEWTEAEQLWLDAVRLEPNSSYSYQHLWGCMARSDPARQAQIWKQVAELLARQPGRLTIAREISLLAAQRFGAGEAERTVSAWRVSRPDDPNVAEALADLLLEYGSGRTDAQRAWELLQPAVEHFPFQFALRFSLADALGKLGKSREAEDVFSETVRRHPDSSGAKIQIARLDERRGRVDEALKTLDAAIAGDPQNASLYEAKAQTLIRARRYREAQAVVHKLLERFPDNLHWRDRAIRISAECGNAETAVAIAREGIQDHPRGAYAWFLLGRTLQELRQFAAPGEVEACLRRSLALDEELFVAADFLAMFLAQQRRYDEAESILRRLSDRMADPSAPLGRLAWIHHEKGDKPGARSEMAQLLRAMPWYAWGWTVLMEWLKQDRAWDEARAALSAIPEVFRTNPQFRQERLTVLENAGLSAGELDAEWESLLRDFPENVPLHLQRYDSLRDAKRWTEAGAVIEHIRAVDPDSPYVLARYVEVLARDPKNQEPATQSLLRILFAETEESSWPADYASRAMQSAHWEETAYRRAFERCQEGARPTFQAISLLAAYAGRQCQGVPQRLRPFWRVWFLEKGAKDLLALLRICDSAAWPVGRRRARILDELCDRGYSRLVVSYSRKNQATVDSDTESWAQAGRALVNIRHKRQSRQLLSGWRQRPGVRMWMLANYALCLSALRRSQIEEMLATCRDALAGLPHDHCAKYLVHRQAECQALLGDRSALLETWKQYRSYFSGKLEKNEWFEARRKHLLEDLPAMAKALEENDTRRYGWMAWKLRWKRFWSRLPVPRGKRANLRWGWIVFWLLWLLYQYARGH